jgi:N-acylneuraminate cytidylyltransferase
MDPRILAIIPARGGSKRIPRKNLRPFNGQPIVKYSIDAALGSKLFGEVMVSTDDQEIAALGRSLGAQVPFLRSAQSSSDTATTAQVLLEVLESYAARESHFDFVCCLYPTAPFVTPARLHTAFSLLREGNVDGVIPVSAFSFPIWRSLKIENQRLAFNWPEHELTRSQDLPAAYQDCGQFYFLRVSAFLQERRLVMQRTAPLVTAQAEMQDIDSEEDWQLAELKHRLLSSPSRE